MTLSWPHPPTHRLGDHGTFFVTAATYLKRHHFRSPDRLEVLHRGLLKVAADFGWQLEAWAVFSNHYHLVGHSPAGSDGAESLRSMLSQLHERTGKWISGREQLAPEKVWFNFWETRLTYEGSYLARLSYVHRNAVKHGLVEQAADYPYCSAAWFERTATKAQVETVYRFDGSKLNVIDDYRPELGEKPEARAEMKAGG